MKPNLTFGKFIEDAVKDHAAEGNHLAEGMAQGVHRRVGTQIVEAQILVGAAVDADGAAEAVGFFVDRPVALVAQVGLNAGRRQHGAAHAELFDDSAQFFDRGLRLLQRNQAHALKARAALHVGVIEPVVVGARDVDGPIAADDLAESETEGGVKHGGFDADVFQKIDPAVGADFVERARLKVMQVGRVQDDRAAEMD